ncbi:galactose mutarotase-like protein [Mycena maculata]|uniref:rhamnogalacturonan endolyase n=1 Tax=Mycena maculata TaxID=230809 RepID=A0AAD7N4U9_9AGAR|nr:galactose mutarotase-like protein [Mycena maculata]
MILVLLSLAAALGVVNAVTVSQTASRITFSDSELSFDLPLTSNGYIQNIVHRNTSILGPLSGLSAQVYTDWPSNAFDNNTAAGSLVQRSWFLRDGEAGLHSFVRLNYYNSSNSLGGLGEVRTMFRPNPNDAPWTHLITNSGQYATFPSAKALANEIEVQNVAWYIGNTPNDPYVLGESDYWTKYSFADNQTNKARGLFGQGTNENLGAWWVINQKVRNPYERPINYRAQRIQQDTFFGGPSHFDLMVDGIIYNKISTSHGGAASPNVTTGLDRTFGPQFLYFNHGKNATLLELLADAEQYADPTWNADFYDEIATYVVGYVPSDARGSFVGKVAWNGVDLQDSAEEDIHAYQYWVEDVIDGSFTIGRVKAGTYRLTVYANGIFGDFVKDNLVVNAKETTHFSGVWKAESAGTEVWRIGTPDRTAGEFKNGWEKDLTRLNQPARRRGRRRIYYRTWSYKEHGGYRTNIHRASKCAWDFPTQFPNGVNFTIGESDVAEDWAWQINFDLASQPSSSANATFTILLAGAATSSGNTGLVQGAFPYVLISNNQSEPFVWTITPEESESCGVRSAISCYLLSNQFVFSGAWLNAGHHKSIYIQYDALRLEISN